MSRPAVFLDRDGVLCEERGYLHSGDKLQIFPYAAEAVRRLHEAGYLAIVITNQSGVARGYLTEAELQVMNRELMNVTGVDAVYYCPHLGELCNCRKPKTGMVEQACRDCDIDLPRSWFVGDRASDIQTGINARLRTALLESGYGIAQLEFDVKPDVVFEDLREFAVFLTERGVEQ